MNAKYDHIRQRLLQEKADLLHQFETNEHFGFDRSHRDSDGELSNYDNHPADTASTLYEREKDIALAEHERRHLEEIEQALQHLAGGTYGRCQECGREIDFERLAAIPTTLYCKEHSQKRRYERERPVEEDVLTGFDQFNYDGEDQTAFDAEDALQAVGRFNERESIYEDDYEYGDAEGVDVEEQEKHERYERLTGGNSAH